MFVNFVCEIFSLKILTSVNSSCDLLLAQVRNMGHSVRIELTNNCMLVKLCNHYPTLNTHLWTAVGKSFYVKKLMIEMPVGKFKGGNRQ